MANVITKEEHERNRRRRMRQMLGAVLFVLVVIGVLNVLGFAASGVAALFDDTDKKMEYEQRLQTLVMFDPLPFASLDQMDDSTARLVKESAIWSAMYSAQRAGTLENYQRDADTDALLMPAVDVDAAIASLYGPDYKITHESFQGVDMNYEYIEDKQAYVIPVTSQIGLYSPKVESLKKKDGKLYVTVGYVPTPALTGDYSLTSPTEPTKYMDYVFEKKDKEYYLVALQTSDRKVDTSAASETSQTPPASNDVFDSAAMEQAQTDSSASTPNEDTSNAQLEQAG